MGLLLLMNAARIYVDQHLEALRRFQADGIKIFGDPTPVYEFVVEHGVEYLGTPWGEFKGSGWRRSVPRECFNNSMRAALRYDLTYVEGFATSGILPVHHAWNLDEQGRVVDFTWRPWVQGVRPPEEWAYFGVPLATDAVIDKVIMQNRASVLFDLPYGDAAVQDFLVAA